MGRIKSGNVFGKITGRVGDKVFYIRYGKQYVREYVYSGVSTDSLIARKCFRAVNKRMVSAFFMEVYLKVKPMMLPMWEELIKGSALVPTNIFIKYNGSLYGTASDNKNFLHKYNIPDLTKFFIADGVWEPCHTLSAFLRDDVIFVKWDSVAYSTGSSEDIVFFIAIQWNLREESDPKWRKSWRDVTVMTNSLPSTVQRKDGHLTLVCGSKFSGDIPIFGYLFLKSADGKYSRGVSTIVSCL